VLKFVGDNEKPFFKIGKRVRAQAISSYASAKAPRVGYQCKRRPIIANKKLLGMLIPVVHIDD
jgi:hypothetical protein